MFPDCPLVKPSEGYEADDNVLNLVTFDTEHVSDEEWRDICRRSRCYNYADRTKGEYISINRGNQDNVAEEQNEYDIPHLDDICDYTIPQEEYEEYDSEEEEEEEEKEKADDCSSNASANHVTREEIHGWIRDDVYAAIRNDKLDEFIEVFNEYIDNPEIEDYFYDYGGRPASSCWEQTNYKYCVCDSEWEEVHRQLERRKCNCVNGKRWILYDLGNEYGAQKIGKYIDESGVLDAGYKVWQRVASEAEEEQFYRDAYDAQYAIDEITAKQEQEYWEALRLEYEEEERKRREQEEQDEEDEAFEKAFAEDRPKTRGEELEEEQEMRIRDREQRRWRLEKWA